MSKCTECQVREGIIAREYRDVCPTDRGDEIREGTEWICEECAGELESNDE